MNAAQIFTATNGTTPKSQTAQKETGDSSEFTRLMTTTADVPKGPAKTASAEEPAQEVENNTEDEAELSDIELTGDEDTELNDAESDKVAAEPVWNKPTTKSDVFHMTDVEEAASSLVLAKDAATMAPAAGTAQAVDTEATEVTVTAGKDQSGAVLDVVAKAPAKQKPVGSQDDSAAEEQPIAVPEQLEDIAISPRSLSVISGMAQDASMADSAEVPVADDQVVPVDPTLDTEIVGGDAVAGDEVLAAAEVAAVVVAPIAPTAAVADKVDKSVAAAVVSATAAPQAVHTPTGVTQSKVALDQGSSDRVSDKELAEAPEFKIKTAAVERTATDIREPVITVKAGAEMRASDYVAEGLRLSDAAATQVKEVPQPPATPKSPIVANVMTHVKSAVIEPGTMTIRLKPHGMGLVEIEVAQDVDGRMEVSLRASNPLVLEALRVERNVIADLLTQQGAQLKQDGLNFDGFGQQDKTGENGKDQKAQSANTVGGDADDQDIADENMRDATGAVGTAPTNILI